jgi:hypothetical protein
MPVTPKPLHVRFWPKIEKGPNADDCWKWIGAKTENGYGVIGAGARGTGVLKAPRASWLIHHGEEPGEMLVCHKCDNPECCNPLHLFLGTNSDNMKDCSNKGRLKIPHRRGEANNKSKLTEAQVIEIRLVYKNRCKINGAQPLGRKHGVHWKTILKVIKNQTWKNK